MFREIFVTGLQNNIDSGGSTDVSYHFIDGLQKFIYFLLKAESDDDMQELFAEVGISIPQNELPFSLTDPELGKPLPKCMYHHLDQDYRNLFRALNPDIMFLTVMD